MSHVDNLCNRDLARILARFYKPRQFLQNSNLVRQLGGVTRDSDDTALAFLGRFYSNVESGGLLRRAPNAETVVGKNGVTLADNPVYEAVRCIELGIPVSISSEKLSTESRRIIRPHGVEGSGDLRSVKAKTMSCD